MEPASKDPLTATKYGNQERIEIPANGASIHSLIKFQSILTTFYFISKRQRSVFGVLQPSSFEDERCGIGSICQQCDSFRGLCHGDRVFVSSRQTLELVGVSLMCDKIPLHKKKGLNGDIFS